MLNNRIKMFCFYIGRFEKTLQISSCLAAPMGHIKCLLLTQSNCTLSNNKKKTFINSQFF